MGSRFSQVSHTDFCYSPVRISKNGLVMYVPCGRCNGCLLQKSNSMSFRLGDEIESSSNNIFFTLTYNNFYVPKMECRVENGMFHWFSARNNIRFNGSYNCLREPINFYSYSHLRAPLKNYEDPMVVGYLCKSDIQLWLKLLRKNVEQELNIKSGAFRYYIIGEYGPGKDPHQGKYRPHYHGIILPASPEIGRFLIGEARSSRTLCSPLYESWKMCDESLFELHAQFCDSGTRHYVTEYITGVTYLPKLLRDTPEVKPFALMSKKNGALGTFQFDRAQVCEDIERGVDEYCKRVSRIERNYIFQYPSKITNSLFPKCTGFNLLSFDGLLRIYEHLFRIRELREYGAPLFTELRELSSQDYTASLACLNVCDLMSWRPNHYVEVLVRFYYRKAMRALRYQYELQIQHIDDPYWCIAWYSNFKEVYNDAYAFVKLPVYCNKSYEVFRFFLGSFGIHLDSFEYDTFLSRLNNQEYIDEVDDIISNADKSKKVNSVVGQSPHIV